MRWQNFLESADGSLSEPCSTMGLIFNEAGAVIFGFGIGTVG
jgi:hypothetical protein